MDKIPDIIKMLNNIFLILSSFQAEDNLRQKAVCQLLKGLIKQFVPSYFLCFGGTSFKEFISFIKLELSFSKYKPFPVWASSFRVSEYKDEVTKLPLKSFMYPVVFGRYHRKQVLNHLFQYLCLLYIF